jgi:hypothetical protein
MRRPETPDLSPPTAATGWAHQQVDLFSGGNPVESRPDHGYPGVILDSYILHFLQEKKDI